MKYIACIMIGFGLGGVYASLKCYYKHEKLDPSKIDDCDFNEQTQDFECE